MELKEKKELGGQMRMVIFKDKYDAGIDFWSNVKRFLNKHFHTNYPIRNMPMRTVEFHNKMTNASLAVISGLVFNTGSQTAFDYGELGTSSATPSASDTTLTAAITDSGLQRIASATKTRVTTSVTNDSAQVTYSWTASGSKTLNEFGIFNAASSGTMLARVLTGSQGVVSGNVVNITYKWVMVGN